MYFTSRTKPARRERPLSGLVSTGNLPGHSPDMNPFIDVETFGENHGPEAQQTTNKVSKTIRLVWILTAIYRLNPKEKEECTYCKFNFFSQALKVTLVTKPPPRLTRLIPPTVCAKQRSALKHKIGDHRAKSTQCEIHRFELNEFLHVET